ncbi:chemotaxis response regulator protein-glutamate methylesterase [uncultured Rubinisphaera sp.]|uniref:protein-glutamate methylesterase/protein-glutamine glutaminase n=1 Tax=uncultured Rubinisphaera sp. TaxID=1678686 RepID=UPI0030D7FEB3
MSDVWILKSLLQTSFPWRNNPVADPFKVFIVDDSLIFRQIVRQACVCIPNVEIVGSSGDGRQAIQKIQELQPDLVTLDLEMPVFSGLEVLKAIDKTKCHSKFIMLSSVTQAGAKETIECLNAGALDFILKPQGSSREENMQKLIKEISARVKLIQDHVHHHVEPTKQPVSKPAAVVPSSTPKVVMASPVDNVCPSNLGWLSDQGVVGIGVSTGGPASLKQVIPHFPRDFPVPILIVQHMPPIFTKSLAQNLNQQSPLEVKEAEQGEKVCKGVVYIAPGGLQMRVANDGVHKVIELTEDPPENSCRPAVDYLFRSLVKEYGSKTLGVIMTGMGSDGFLGAQAIRKAHGKVFVQDQETCVVYGMPRFPTEAGIVDAILPLHQISQAVQRATTQECFV